MGHSTTTTNLALPQFGDTDKPSWLGDFNSAMNLIDEAYGTSRANIDTNTTNLGALTTRVSNDEAAFNGNVSAFLGGPAGDILDADGNLKPEHLSNVFVATGADDTAALNTFLADTTPSGSKKLIGDFALTGTITFPLSDAVLDLTDARITTTVATDSVLKVTGNRATVIGGKITSPASWDGSNTGADWTWSTVFVTGADCTIRGMTLVNVPRMGIGFKGADGISRALDCNVTGNYPAAQWTEVETNNIGVTFDPSVNSSKLIARGNVIKSCVQGIFLGNYNAGSSTGSIVANNTFEGCHNHAVYGSASVTEIVVIGNTMVDCSRPITVTGSGHVVANNIMTTTLANGNLSEACGIQMRDAVNCVVAFNTMKGSTHNTGPAIDLIRVTAGVVDLYGNRVIGNRIHVTGANTGVGIRVGSGVETNMHSNIIANNEVRANGVANQGMIAIFGTTGSQAYGCKVVNNTIVIAGNANGVYASETRGLDIAGNHVRLEYDAVAATTLAAVLITNNAAATKVANNDFEVVSSFGANVTFRGISEAAAAGTNGRYSHNRFSFDPTKLAGSATHVLQTTSNSVITEVGMTGAPNTVCGPGSTWSRADGGANTTFYVKESAGSSNLWRAI